MNDAFTRLNSLCRPKILVRAARIGVGHCNRDRTLRRLMPGESPPAPGHAFDVLWDHEQALDQTRRDGAAAYSPARHVELLSALINEARLTTSGEVA